MIYRYVALCSVMLCFVNFLEASPSGERATTPELRKDVNTATRLSTCSRNKNKNQGRIGGIEKLSTCSLNITESNLHFLSQSDEFKAGLQLKLDDISVSPSGEELIIVELDSIKIEGSWFDDTLNKKDGSF